MLQGTARVLNEEQQQLLSRETNAVYKLGSVMRIVPGLDPVDGAEPKVLWISSGRHLPFHVTAVARCCVGRLSH